MIGAFLRNLSKVCCLSSEQHVLLRFCLIWVLNWLRQFLPRFTELVTPLQELVTKGHEGLHVPWTTDHNVVLKKIKSLLIPYVTRNKERGFV